MFLLVTNRRDITMDFVVAKLQRRGLPYFRLNTELLPLSRSTLGVSAMDDWAIELEGNELQGVTLLLPIFAGLARHKHLRQSWMRVSVPTLRRNGAAS